MKSRFIFYTAFFLILILIIIVFILFQKPIEKPENLKEESTSQPTQPIQNTQQTQEQYWKVKTREQHGAS